MDPTPSLLSFGEVITLVRQRLNASSEKAAVVVREALKSGELHIVRDEHVDPISGSQFAIVEENFLEWLNRQVATQATTPQPTRKPDRERIRQAAIELWGTAGPPDHLSNLSICRDVVQWLKKNGRRILATLRSFALSVENNDQTNDRPSLPATLVRRTPPNYYVIRDADGQRAELCLFRLLAQKPTSRPHCDTKCSQRLAMLHFEGDQNPFTLTSPSSSPVGAFFNEGTPLPRTMDD